jgi:ABC-type multidrug transport system fused ATPase/permease subunit
LHISVVAGVQLITNFFRVRIMSRVGQHVLYDVRTAMFDHLQKLSLSFYNRYSVGRVITRVINDVGTLREFVTWAVLAIVRNFLAIIGTLIAMLSLNLRLVAAHVCSHAADDPGDDPVPPRGADGIIARCAPRSPGPTRCWRRTSTA